MLGKVGSVYVTLVWCTYKLLPFGGPNQGYAGVQSLEDVDGLIQWPVLVPVRLGRR